MNEEKDKLKLDILYLEDNEDDFALLSRLLSKSNLNYNLNHISTKNEFLAQDLERFDLLITDYNLQDFDGLSAIKHVRSINIDIPVIMLSGTVGEELAIDLLKAGANDFVLKSNMEKMPLVIGSVMKSATMNREKKRFQKELVQKNLILDTIFDSFEDLIFLKDPEGRYLKVNRPFCEFLKKHEGELIGCKDTDIFQDPVAKYSQEQDDYVRLSGKPVTYEVVMKVDNVRRILEATKTPLVVGDEVTGIVGKYHDVTAKKLMLEETMKAKSILSQAEKLTRSGSFEYDTDLDLIHCNANFKHVLKLQIDGDTISFRKFTQLLKEEDRSLFDEGVSNAIENYEEYLNEHRFNIGLKGEHTLKYFKVVLRPDYKDTNSTRFYGTIVDVTAERESQIQLNNRQERDRKEIARELHDNLGQKMSGISMYVSKISDDLPDNKDLKKVKGLVHEAIDDLSYLINSISVKQIEEHSLDYAIEKIIGYMPEKMNVDKIFKIKEEKLSSFTKEQLFRVIQEALNNIVKYSKATDVEVSLIQDGGIVNLAINDNGVGFDIEKTLNGGNGLYNITHRIRQCNGLVKIDSQKGKGTWIVAKVPVK